MHGIQLKRQGNDVIILEQDPNSERRSQAAGIGFSDNLDEFLRTYDTTGLRTCIVSPNTHISWRKYTKIYRLPVPRNLTSWGLLYRILRASFDGLATAACPDPPPHQPGDGRVEYRLGKRVTGLEYTGEHVTVRYVDVSDASAGEESVVADLVLGADGIQSTVRKLVQAPMTKEYSGYVVWRAVVPEKAISRETSEFFADGLCFEMLKGSYMVWYVCPEPYVMALERTTDQPSYIIPTDEGCFEPGERLINWLWYYNVDEGSPEMTQIFTDIHGTYHRNTVAVRLVRPDVWAHHRDTAVPTMGTPFAELVQKTESPFVSKVNDAECPQTSTWCGGRVVLVGDAFNAVRPHMGLATDHAAWQCLSLGRTWQGSMGEDEYHRDLLFKSRYLWLISRVIGVYGQGSWFAFFRSAFSFVAFLAKWKLLRRF